MSQSDLIERGDSAAVSAAQAATAGTDLDERDPWDQEDDRS